LQNPRRGRILATVTGAEPKKKTENKKGANSIQPPSLLGKVLAQIEQPHKKGKWGDEREGRPLDKALHTIFSKA
jgi:hypothetical protein